MDPRNIIGNLSIGSIYTTRNGFTGESQLLPLPLNLIALIISYVHIVRCHLRNTISELTC